jgi:hypothetical protein
MKFTGCYPVWWWSMYSNNAQKKVARGLENEKCDWEKKKIFCAVLIFIFHLIIYIFLPCCFCFNEKKYFLPSHPLTHTPICHFSHHTVVVDVVRVKLSTFLFFFLHSPEKKNEELIPRTTFFLLFRFSHFYVPFFFFFTFLINY